MLARRLLVYEVKRGWEPLCEFLGVEAPREPFPRLNERDQFPELMRRAMLSELPRSAGKLVAVASALVLVLWALRPGTKLVAVHSRQLGAPQSGRGALD